MMLKAYKEWVHIKGSKTLREKPVMLQQFKAVGQKGELN